VARDNACMSEHGQMTVIRYTTEGPREIAWCGARPVADIIPDRSGKGGGWLSMPDTGRSGFWTPRWVESRVHAKVLIEKRFSEDAAS
jgi:hypothetical protein